MYVFYDSCQMYVVRSSVFCLENVYQWSTDRHYDNDIYLLVMQGCLYTVEVELS